MLLLLLLSWKQEIKAWQKFISAFLKSAQTKKKLIFLIFNYLYNVLVCILSMEILFPDPLSFWQASHTPHYPSIRLSISGRFESALTLPYCKIHWQPHGNLNSFFVFPPISLRWVYWPVTGWRRRLNCISLNLFSFSV